MAHPHWQYFLAIESDLENTSRYVEVAPENFKTFSVEYARILLSASSEVDVVSKLLCQSLDPTASPNTINDYRRIITSYIPKFHTFEITIPRYGIIRTPWHDWNQCINPSWWKSYNNVKHERHKFFTEANMENALDAVSGLFCLVLTYYRRELYKAGPWPKLLSIEEHKLLEPFI